MRLTYSEGAFYEVFYFMKYKKVIGIMMLCAMLTFLTVSCAKTSNGLMDSASPETSALILYVYSGESDSVVSYTMYDVETKREILEKLDRVKAQKSETWTADEVTAPIYAIDIGSTDGYGISAAWSNGYIITDEGEAYRFDFNFADLIDGYEWENERGRLHGWSAMRVLFIQKG